jgi:hypothetical protein
MSSNNLPVSSSNDVPNISENDDDDGNNDNGVLVSPTATTAQQDTDVSLPLPLPIHLPPVKYGYRTTRYEWLELQQIILVEQNLDKLCRSENQQMEYERFKQKLTQTWKSVLDYVLCTKLDVPRCVQKETGLAYAQLYPSPVSSPSSPLPALPLPSPKTIVLRNDFPYYTAENIHHYVLWKLHGICSDDDITQAKEDVKQELELGNYENNGDGDDGENDNGQAVVVDCLHWVNPPHLKSLPDIDHVHILCLLQQR